ncbi:GNAT family N-acetyltransferase [Crocinitomix algicola]|uniref:GNAT family N-acetyltransferase n=1 Tax=Crocinitomix algicola TaxID=1740263 RepID=UPI0008726390|nr:GNAT family N-acetyltransferase [Crocinitomix algicola]
MEILKAEITDDKILTKITKESKAYWGFPTETLLKWEHLLTISQKYIEENNVIKLVNNTEIIGYYSFFKIDKKTLKLDNLFILPSYIGIGLGKVLMNHFLDQTKKLGIEKITLEAEPNAEDFYKKFGFVTIGQLESSIKDRFLPIMELKLNE